MKVISSTAFTFLTAFTSPISIAHKRNLMISLMSCRRTRLTNWPGMTQNIGHSVSHSVSHIIYSPLGPSCLLSTVCYNKQQHISLQTTAGFLISINPVGDWL